MYFNSSEIKSLKYFIGSLRELFSGRGGPEKNVGGNIMSSVPEICFQMTFLVLSALIVVCGDMFPSAFALDSSRSTSDNQSSSSEYEETSVKIFDKSIYQQT